MDLSRRRLTKSSYGLKHSTLLKATRRYWLYRPFQILVDQSKHLVSLKAEGFDAPSLQAAGS
ncbi:hypothetical protein FOMG_19934 [Fusarium oxysporum f. sp. melonis 26406]|uniref:Uncharacterized protein n=1 Tax=Fusarium oxysporum f. sp. melonis 26406 TaxID=1089452 RepID=W9YVS1_FUSOX|nr:hypothetical protein FOMG_19934 [Fusarium oxysporum f. sp. melonis 26406]